MNDLQTIASNFEAVRAEIAAVGGHRVELLPVTKGFGPEALVAAIENGSASVGENYVQEVIAKLDQYSQRWPSAPIPKVEFIGQLQTNKVKYLAGLVARYCSVDRPSLVREIARRDPGAQILIQVNPFVGDASADNAHRAEGVAPGATRQAKGGCSLAELDGLIARATAAGLDPVGLMSVGPTQGGPEAARFGFAEVRAEVDRLGLEVCSMGMSNDLAVAIEVGSTQVRVGTRLFGERKTRVG